MLHQRHNHSRALERLEQKHKAEMQAQIRSYDALSTSTRELRESNVADLTRRVEQLKKHNEKLDRANQELGARMAAAG